MESEQIGVSGSETGSTSVARHGVEEAKKIGNSARRRVYSKADERKSQFFERAGSWLDEVEKLGDKGIVPEGVFEKVRDVSETLRSRSTEDLVEELGVKVRQRPGTFVLGALVLGFIGARLLRDVGTRT